MSAEHDKMQYTPTLCWQDILFNNLIYNTRMGMEET